MASRRMARWLAVLGLVFASSGCASDEPTREETVLACKAELFELERQDQESAVEKIDEQVAGIRAVLDVIEDDSDPETSRQIIKHLDRILDELDQLRVEQGCGIG